MRSCSSREFECCWRGSHRIALSILTTPGSARRSGVASRLDRRHVCLVQQLPAFECLGFHFPWRRVRDLAAMSSVTI